MSPGCFSISAEFPWNLKFFIFFFILLGSLVFDPAQKTRGHNCPLKSLFNHWKGSMMRIFMRIPGRTQDPDLQRILLRYQYTKLWNASEKCFADKRRLYEGDLLLTTHEYKELKTGAHGHKRGFTPGRQWPDGKIAFKLDSSLGRTVIYVTNVVRV